MPDPPPPPEDKRIYARYPSGRVIWYSRQADRFYVDNNPRPFYSRAAAESFMFEKED